MIRCLLLLAVLYPASESMAIEGRWASGLDVVIERISGPLAVDGVEMTIHQATGPDVPKLAKRIESWWISLGSEVRSMQQGSWTLRSRMRGVASEVLQWRQNPAGYELIWSSVDTARPVLPVSDAGFDLPAGCTWSRSVSGSSQHGRYQQRSARCSLQARELYGVLRQMLPTQGWRVRTAGDGGLLLDKSGAAALLSIMSQPDDHATWLTWLRVEQDK
jgi:hypothetical protein